MLAPTTHQLFTDLGILLTTEFGVAAASSFRQS